ncbi:ABC-ATPase domain-containing protein [Mechercharimyces sp. CAU 1602]|uniref:ABC-ATPase domain-containing protein n=1 Tax=Mechercharimyces sp. CAU 1602 TaxID=2973933 RepID=UPI002163EBDB|nr:ABC-ATPase domain-containing protein [Mechercharimyces sp. CAU 1602]MCS1351715.1 ABC-ATPase domain-containing protein [Mechercharimyces sp. CAU 1602]
MLEQSLIRIDGKGYKAYKDIQGEYAFPDYTLYIDYVQGDPFASPSRIRVRMEQKKARYQLEWFKDDYRRVALEDLILRKWVDKIKHYAFRVHGTGKSGMMMVDTPGQEILPRTAVVVTSEYVEVRMSVGLPAQGRRVLGRKAAQMLCQDLPQLVAEALPMEKVGLNAIEKRMRLIDNQRAIRHYLKKHHAVAFVQDGAILPRASGISDRPLSEGNVVPFVSPETMCVEINVPHGEVISGMLIPRGITLIVGGGYHGKSTLLRALERGVYDHVESDGRHYVITDDHAIKVRAEDGRRVEKVNISPFINNLPLGGETTRFSSEDASGSTSQAANIMESLEVGASTLLIDEDTSATNFMIRDGRMQELVTKGKEPITPFIDKVKQLFEEKGVSSILVLGGSGDYFDVADHIIMMDEYRPYEVTKKAKDIARIHTHNRKAEGGSFFGDVTARVMMAHSFDARKGKKEKADAKGLHQIIYGNTELDLLGLEQLVDRSQTRAIADMMRVLEKRMDGSKTLMHVLEELYKQIENEGLDCISPYQRGVHPGDLALPRMLELAGAINRLRTLKVRV